MLRARSWDRDEVCCVFALQELIDLVPVDLRFAGSTFQMHNHCRWSYKCPCALRCAEALEAKVRLMAHVFVELRPGREIFFARLTAIDYFLRRMPTKMFFEDSVAVKAHIAV
jgi:hypothetical protein